MRKLLGAICVALLFAVAGCATNATTGQTQVYTPKSDLQSVYVGEISLANAIRGVAAAHASGAISDARYDAAKALEPRAEQVLKDARTSAKAGDATTTLTLTTTFASLLNQILAYQTEAK